MIDAAAVRRAAEGCDIVFHTAAKPGVWAVLQTWPAEGKWVVNLKGVCGSQNAGSVVPMGPRGFMRESAKFFRRPATAGEIETSLKALSEGAKQ